MNHPHYLLSGVTGSDTADLILSALVFGVFGIGVALLHHKYGGGDKTKKWPRPGHTVRDTILGGLGGATGYLIAQLILNQAGC